MHVAGGRERLGASTDQPKGGWTKSDEPGTAESSQPRDDIEDVGAIEAGGHRHQKNQASIGKQVLLLKHKITLDSCVLLDMNVLLVHAPKQPA